LQEAPAGFGLERLATVFMNNPGKPAVMVKEVAPS